eukprot:3869038-Alexandrium_andersonii.AAC.1
MASDECHIARSILALLNKTSALGHGEAAPHVAKASCWEPMVTTPSRTAFLKATPRDCRARGGAGHDSHP